MELPKSCAKLSFINPEPAGGIAKSTPTMLLRDGAKLDVVNAGQQSMSRGNNRLVELSRDRLDQVVTRLLQYGNVANTLDPQHRANSSKPH